MFLEHYRVIQSVDMLTYFDVYIFLFYIYFICIYFIYFLTVYRLTTSFYCSHFLNLPYHTLESENMYSLFTKIGTYTFSKGQDKQRDCILAVY